MIGIAGSGFGLYGYLPAIVSSTSDTVLLRKKAMPVFKKRPELQFCTNRISWAEDDKGFYESIETLVLSVPPFVQVQVINEWGHLENIKQLVLEKPVAVNPLQSSQLLNFLEKNNKQIIVGYTFQYTDWASELKEAIAKKDNLDGSIYIQWNFKAHHYKNDMQNWKRYHSMGGGVIRFFGIHLIALLSSIGYTNASSSHSKGFSEDDIFLWKASFTGVCLPAVHVSINTNASKNCFNIDALASGLSIKLAGPFERTEQLGSTDKRVNILSSLIKELLSMKKARDYYESYKKINQLWKKVEEINRNTIFRI